MVHVVCAGCLPEWSGAGLIAIEYQYVRVIRVLGDLKRMSSYSHRMAPPFA